MTRLKINIDNINYEVECEDGEEKLLREAEKIINNKLIENPQLKALSQSKKFLMISLILAADLNSMKNKSNFDEINFKKIIFELSELEKTLGF